MKRLLMMSLCLFWLVGYAQAVTITGMKLYGGNGESFDTWAHNTQTWGNLNDGGYVLGVSQNPGAAPTFGPLLNLPDTTISIPCGNYYLYAEPTFLGLGQNPQLRVWLSNNTVTSAIFKIVGERGAGTSWTRTDGNKLITLGWASGTADLVGTYQSMVPSGINDFYLQVGIFLGVQPGVLDLLLLD